MNYFLNLAATALAAFGLAKDWNAHKSVLRRGAVVTLVVLVGALSLVNTHRNNKKATLAEQAHENDVSTVRQLKTAVETANKAQADNTKQFLDQFTKLGTKLGDLQTQVQTADLQQEANQLRVELASTRAALSPPLATLSAAVATVGGDEGLKKKTLHVALGTDRVVTFTVLVNNTSKVQARNVAIAIRLCVDCSFAVEPLAFTRAPGAEARERQLLFKFLPATETISSAISVRLPPSTTRGFSIGVLTRCENCEVNSPQTLKFFFEP